MALPDLISISLNDFDMLLLYGLPAKDNIEKQQILQQSESKLKMSLHPLRNRQFSLQQSQVSSSSSNSSQGYELIPRQQPYFNPTRDIASPRASFPFRKVQSGNESAGSRVLNESRGSIKGSARDQSQARDIEITAQFNHAYRDVERQRESMRSSAIHDDCNLRNKEAQKRIEDLQQMLEDQRNQFDLQRKANEIYTQGFTKIRQIISTKYNNFKGEGMEQLVDKLAEFLQTRQVVVDPSNTYHIIQQQDKKIRQLRAQLLRSTQNNINAIFNTQITQAYLLQSQIQKMNMEITNLKQKLIKATTDNQQNIAKILQNNSNSPQVKKIIKYFKFSWDSESEGEEISKQVNRNRKEKKDKLRESRERSSSERNHRNRQLINTQNKFNDLIQGYKSLKDQYRNLLTMLTQINGSQIDFKESFSTLKRDITISIQNQIKEVKQTIKRPSSNTEQLRMAREMQLKLNDLVNTLNAPEKVNIEREMEDEDNNNWKNVEVVRRLAELQAKNRQLEHKLKKVSDQRDYLHDTIAKNFGNKPLQFNDF